MLLKFDATRPRAAVQTHAVDQLPVEMQTLITTIVRVWKIDPRYLDALQVLADTIVERRETTKGGV